MNISISHFLLQTDDGALLPSLLYSQLDGAPAGNKELLIYLHGAGSSSIVRRPELTNTLASTLWTINVDMLTFNNRGAGYITKFDTVEGGTLLGGMAYERIADSVYDIRAALLWAKDAGYKKVYLAGHSTGANKLVYWSSHAGEEDLSFVGSIFLTGGGDDISLQRGRYEAGQLQGVLEQIQVNEKANHPALVPASLFPGDHPISWHSLSELLTPGSNYDAFPFARANEQGAFDLFRDMRHANIAVIYGSRDFGTIVPPREALDLLAKMRGITPYLVEGADHNFTNSEVALSENIKRHIQSLIS